MIKFRIIILILCAIIIPICVFAETDYSDARAALNQIITIQEKYIRSVKNSLKSNDIIDALKAFGDDLSSIYPKIKEIDKKYPALGDGKKMIPADVNVLLKNSQKVSERLGQMTLLMIYRYSYSPEVKKAIAELNNRLREYEK
jgi:hypothetical protein